MVVLPLQDRIARKAVHHPEKPMSADLLTSIELETAPHPTASVIWLHGLGADGNDFVPIVPELGLPEALAVRFIFPHAPVRAVTNRADLGGVRQSQAEIEALIERETARGIRAERIVLAGFSQGGAVALYTGLRLAERLAGIMALSAYLIAPDALAAEATAAAR